MELEQQMFEDYKEPGASSITATVFSDMRLIHPLCSAPLLAERFSSRARLLAACRLARGGAASPPPLNTRAFCPCLPALPPPRPCAADSTTGVKYLRTARTVYNQLAQDVSTVECSGAEGWSG